MTNEEKREVIHDYLSKLSTEQLCNMLYCKCDLIETIDDMCQDDDEYADSLYRDAKKQLENEADKIILDK